jgi:hypothetical protein
MSSRSRTVARLLASLVGLAVVVVAFVPTGKLALDWLGRAAISTASPAGRPRTASAVAPGGLRTSPPPDRPIPATDLFVSPNLTPELPGGSPGASPAPPIRPFDMDVARDGVFVSEATKVACASAAVQIVVNLAGPRVDTSTAFQRRITSLAADFTTPADSSNGGWGPAGMAAAITHLSGAPYELRVAPSRSAALRLAATAIRATDRPVVLLVWRGAHAWVMTGFTATRDPRDARAFTVTAARILDPWFPRVSSIWGPSAAPDRSHDAADLIRNYLPWKRPEGRYPGRDGQFLLLVPVTGSVGGA